MFGWGEFSFRVTPGAGRDAPPRPANIPKRPPMRPSKPPARPPMAPKMFPVTSPSSSSYSTAPLPQPPIASRPSFSRSQSSSAATGRSRPTPPARPNVAPVASESAACSTAQRGTQFTRTVPAPAFNPFASNAAKKMPPVPSRQGFWTFYKFIRKSRFVALCYQEGPTE